MIRAGLAQSGILIMILAVVACSSGNKPAVDAGQTADGSGDAVGIGGTTGGGGAGGQAGSTGSKDSGTTDSTGAGGIAGCGTLPNTGSLVIPTSLSAVRRDYTGGALADGVYDLMAVEQTDPIMAGESYRRSISIQSQATAFQWAINDVNVSGSDTLDLAGGIALSGASVTFSGTCAPGNDYFYTASGSQFTLYFVPPNISEKIFHFQSH